MQKKTVNKIICVIVALVLAALAFTAGYFTRKLTRPQSASSFEWALETIEKNYYFGGVEDTFGQTSVSALVDTYLDRYSQYYTAEEYKSVIQNNAGSKSGIGISYSFVEGKGVYISSVVGNSPAYMCGLREGEVLKSGNITGKKQVEFTSAESFSNLIKGAADGEKIELKAIDGSPYVVAKAEYTASYTYMCTNSTAWEFGDAESGGLALYENTDKKMSFLPDGAAYFRLTQFYGTAAKEFYRLAEKFNALNCTSLILDLRSNGGGYVSVMQEIAGCFAGGARKPAMFSRDKHGNEEVYYCTKVTRSQNLISSDVKVYVLANGGTASASEALMGAMLCYGALSYENIYLSQYSEQYLNWLKGTGQEQKNARTYGKGIMQSTFENNSTGEALKLTTAKIFWPDGKSSIHDRGITLADGCAASPAEWEHTKADEELKWVVEKIKSKN